MTKVFALYYKHENGMLKSCSQTFNDSLRKLGYTTDIINLANASDITRLSEELSSGNVSFCYGVQGVGSNLEVGKGISLWEARRTPFICMHYDSPCHNPFNHFNSSPFVANLYFFESFLDIKQRYLPSNQISVFTPFKLPMTWPSVSRHIAYFENRPIRLLYIKSGGSLNELENYINGLPSTICDETWEQLERTRKDPNLQLCDLVNEIFTRAGMDRRQQERDFWGLVQTMDTYIRRKRAIEMVNWLKFQDGAVIVGDGWDFVDFNDIKALFRPSLPLEVSEELYVLSRFVCNTTPYGRDIIHERVLTGLYTGACVISDTNEWWDNHFRNVPALTRFDWNSSLDNQLNAVLVDADAAMKAQTGPQAVVDSFVQGASAQPLIDLAEKVRHFTGS